MHVASSKLSEERFTLHPARWFHSLSHSRDHIVLSSECLLEDSFVTALGFIDVVVLHVAITITGHIDNARVFLDDLE